MSAAYYWCLSHHRVEGEDGCANIDRMGPYPSRAEAEQAPARAQARTEAMDAEDEAEDDWGRPPA